MFSPFIADPLVCEEAEAEAKSDDLLGTSEGGAGAWVMPRTACSSCGFIIWPKGVFRTV